MDYRWLFRSILITVFSFAGTAHGHSENTFENIKRNDHETCEGALTEVFGFTPILRHLKGAHNQSITVLEPETKMELATIIFYVDENLLEIDSMEVASSFRRRGVSAFLLSKAIKMHDSINAIQSALAKDNLKVFRDSVEKLRRLGQLTDSEICRQAIQATPAYKSQERLGFRFITNCDFGVFDHISDRVIRYPQFTVRLK